MRTLLIDGDIIAYQAAAVAQTPFECPSNPDFVVIVLDLAAAKRTIQDYVTSLQDQLKADAAILALTSGTNFRYSVLPTYKHNRKGVRPVGLPLLRAWITDHFKTFEREGLEGDDVLGILATHPSLVAGEKIIVSIDKDLKTIPGKMVHRIEEGIIEITEEEANRYHLAQTLTGDTTDGYKGCPGMGPKTVDKLFDEKGVSWATVVGAFEKQGLTEEDALVQARVARICQHTDYNFKSKEVILWSPQ